MCIRDSQYAVRAFEFNAADYLLKPFTSERLRSAIQRVREQLKVQTSGPAAVSYTHLDVYKRQGLLCGQRGH